MVVSVGTLGGALGAPGWVLGGSLGGPWRALEVSGWSLGFFGLTRGPVGLPVGVTRTVTCRGWMVKLERLEQFLRTRKNAKGHHWTSRGFAPPLSSWLKLRAMKTSERRLRAWDYGKRAFSVIEVTLRRS